jgi:arylsulfatase A-like enzyme
MISAMDKSIGAVNMALTRSQQLQHTFILFTSCAFSVYTVVSDRMCTYMIPSVVSPIHSWPLLPGMVACLFCVVANRDNGAPYGAAYGHGDSKAMEQPQELAKVTRNARGHAGPDRPPSGGNGTHTHGGGGGSNYPYSGWKHYVFEGGVRSCSFVHFPGLKFPGTQHHGLFRASHRSRVVTRTPHLHLDHCGPCTLTRLGLSSDAVDWLPTITKLAGVDTSRNLPLDGMDICQFLHKAANLG